MGLSFASAIPSLISLFFITGALALMILVSISVPIIKTLSFLTGTNGGNILNVGQWGVCGSGGCSGRSLHYPILQYIQNDLGLANANLSGTIENLTYALVLNPIFAGFCFVAFLSVFLPAIGIKAGPLHRLASVWLLLTWIFGLAALGIDLGYTIRVRNAIRAAGGNVNGVAGFGKSMWFVIASVGAITIAMIFTWCSAGIAGRKRNKDRQSRDYFDESREPGPVAVQESHTDAMSVPARPLSQPSYLETSERPSEHRENSELLTSPGHIHGNEAGNVGQSGYASEHNVTSQTYAPYGEQSYANQSSYPSTNAYNSQPVATVVNEKRTTQVYGQNNQLLANHESYRETPPHAQEHSSFAPIPYVSSNNGGFLNEKTTNNY